MWSRITLSEDSMYWMNHPRGTTQAVEQRGVAQKPVVEKKTKTKKSTKAVTEKKSGKEGRKKKKRKTGKKKKTTQQTNSKMVELNSIILISSLHANGLNTPVRRKVCQTRF